MTSGGRARRSVCRVPDARVVKQHVSRNRSWTVKVFTRISFFLTSWTITITICQRTRVALASGGSLSSFRVVALIPPRLRSQQCRTQWEFSICVPAHRCMPYQGLKCPLNLLLSSGVLKTFNSNWSGSLHTRSAVALFIVTPLPKLTLQLERHAFETSANAKMSDNTIL